jgi:hypothetical protein
VGTFDGSEIRLYNNGVLFSKVDCTISPQSSTNGIHIARRWDKSTPVDTNFLPCDIGIIRIYDNALSEEQVLQNFEAQKTRYLE